MACGNHSRKQGTPLRILLTNGRFPVSIDLARQLHRAGYTVFCVDPMEYHVCRFSTAVKCSTRVPAPHDDPRGYVAAVRKQAIQHEIDIIFPLHEEIFVLADSGESEILRRLFAPPFELLIRLHHKWELTKLAKSLGLDMPQAWLCTNIEDVRNLPVKQFPDGLALKPCIGRASANIYHLRPDEPIPNDIDVAEDNQYIAQEWTKGKRYCGYSVIRKGKLEASSLYPVLDTIDGSSSIYFRQEYNTEVYRYIDELVTRLPPFDGQIAFDFVQTADRLVIIECNPRSTSGLHSWTGTPWLARAITGQLSKGQIERPIKPPKRFMNKESHVQVAAGMLMWEHKDATCKVYFKHMMRLMGSRDVIWRWRDPMPTIAQPFLLSTYYSMCRAANLQLPELFQIQLLWEPKDIELDRIRRLFKDADGRG